MQLNQADKHIRLYTRADYKTKNGGMPKRISADLII